MSDQRMIQTNINKYNFSLRIVRQGFRTSYWNWQVFLRISEYVLNRGVNILTEIPLMAI